MTLASGTRLGPYEIVAPIGAGGMGEVYRARDTRLDRTVAIKVLAPGGAADADSRERFEREAKSISALDHPHICSLYDVGESDGVRFLVMQFLEGDTLADRLARQRMAVDDAFQAAMQIAGALVAAHRAGIVHRDLKPGNIMLTKSGVKLLDFGLAKITAPSGPVAGLTMAATRSAPLTAQGTLLGTLQYMSPEQLEGREADARSDIFAFGAILYEMLTGHRAFDAGSQAGIIAAILATDPRSVGDAPTAGDTAFPAGAQRLLDRLLKKCFAKKPDDRWQSAADLADELKWIAEERQREPAIDVEMASPTTDAVRPRRVERLLIASTAVATVAAVAIGVWAMTRTPPAAAPIRFTIQPPDGEVFATGGPAFLALSPDGTKLAFITGTSNETHRLWVRSLDSLVARPIAGTESAWNPTWSADSRSIAFTVGDNGGRLKRVDIIGGQAVTLADWGFAQAWSRDGVIIFVGQDGLLYRVDANGGPAAAVTAFDRTRAEVGHNAGFFLSDARRFVLQARAVDPAKSAIFLGSIDATVLTPLGLDIPTKPAYGNGYLVYVQAGALMARPFNSANGSATGEAVPLVEDVDYNPRNGRAGFSISSNDVLAYRSGMSMTSGTLDWFDMTGQRVASLPFQGGYAGLSRPQVSPDGHRLAVARSDSTHYDVWIVDLERGIPSRLNSSDRLANNYPVWSPDGAFVVFRSTETPFGPGSGIGGNLYRHSAFGGGTDELLYKSPEDARPFAISPDAKTLLFGRPGPGTEMDIWALPLVGDRKPYPVVVSKYTDGQASFSPDGHWFAYCSHDVAPDQVYVEPFPPDGSTRIRLSTTSGSSPVWSRDGKRVFYSTADKHIMAVDVGVEQNTLRAGVPRDLFVARSEMFTHGGFAVDATGTRFLLPVSKQDENAPAITVVLNWTAGLPKR